MKLKILLTRGTRKSLEEFNKDVWKWTIVAIIIFLVFLVYALVERPWG